MIEEFHFGSLFHTSLASTLASRYLFIAPTGCTRIAESGAPSNSTEGTKNCAATSASGRLPSCEEGWPVLRSVSRGNSRGSNKPAEAMEHIELLSAPSNVVGVLLLGDASCMSPAIRGRRCIPILQRGV